MKASFSYAVIYSITAVCDTPLRTGNTEGDIQEVLRDSDGRLLLQGASIAGALRQWVRDHTDVAGADIEQRLFGSQTRTGHLIVSDGVFEDKSEINIRPRLRIDGKTGTAEKGKKFDIAHIIPGSEFDYSLTWLGERREPAEEAVVEMLLSAIQGGEIRFGAQKTNGFGHVSLKSVRKAVYDLTDAEDRNNWLNRKDPKNAKFLPQTGTRGFGVRFSLEGNADNILVKSGASEQKDGGSVTENIRENGTPIIPGSSVKGAIRARCEYIASGFSDMSALVRELFGAIPSEVDGVIPGKVIFSDIMLDHARNISAKRIRINRFTGGVIRGALFEECALASPFKTEIVVSEGLSSEAYALLCYALRDLGCGFYNLGSGGSIGRGFVRVQSINITTADGRSAALKFDDQRRCTVEDSKGLLDDWMNAWKERVKA